MLSGALRAQGACQYIYPIGAITYGDSDQILAVWQTDMHSLQLYRWDPVTRYAEKELFSLYVPAGVRVLPGKKAYSFVDQGRVRVKELIKRSPATIDFELPIYNISLIHWIDDQVAYCHAQEGHHFGVYIFDRQGDVYRIAYDRLYDYLFPQLINETFFCIRRSASAAVVQYEICSINRYTKHQQMVIDYGDQPIAFLYMENDSRGYIMTHQVNVSDGQESIPFSYHMIERHNDHWVQRELFAFSIPVFLLDGQSDGALYENILPLLPYHDGRYIYYPNAEGKAVLWYCYDVVRHVNDVCVNAQKAQQRTLLLSPRKYCDQLLFGGLLQQKKDRSQLPKVEVTENDQLTFDFFNC